MTLKPMPSIPRLHYISYSPVPSRKANSIQVMRMCHAFSTFGPEVTLFCRHGEPDVDDVHAYYGVPETFRIHRIRVPSLRVIDRLLYAWRVLSHLRTQSAPSVVYARDPFVAGLICLFRPGQFQLLLEVHAPPPTPFWQWWTGRMVRSRTFDGLVAISDALASEYTRRFSVLETKRVLVAHDAAEPAPSPQASVRHSHQDKISTRLQVGYVGSLRPGKAMEMICQLPGRMPEFDFHVVGGDDQSVNDWKQKARYPNLIFHGFTEPANVSTLLQKFDVVLAPYQPAVLAGNDNIDIAPWMSPLKIFEYMRAQKPIVASDLPVLREILEHERNALLAKADDADDWQTKITRLAEDETLRLRIGLNGYRDFAAKHTWTKRAETILLQISGPTDHVAANT